MRGGNWKGLLAKCNPSNTVVAHISAILFLSPVLLFLPLFEGTQFDPTPPN